MGKVNRLVQSWNADTQRYEVDNEPEDQENFIKEIMSDELNILHQRIDKLEELLHSGLGSCPQCTGSGMIYVSDEAMERQVPEACETCKGSGKMPLDLVDMMEQLKIQAHKEIEISKDIPF